ncbi:MAG: lysophospholipid acyltransferase family protein [Polyangiales bacterium]
MLKWVAQTWLKAMGWRVNCPLPDERKYVILAAPHTSNWDGLLMVLMNYACGLRCNWMVKDDVMRFPFKSALRGLGAVPIDRSKSGDLVAQVAEHFRSNEEFHLLIAPEGTRSYRDYWKSGFYHIARQAEVPVLLSYLNYKDKIGGFGPMVVLSGDSRKDMDAMRAFYRAEWSHTPANFGPIRLRDEESSAQAAAQ